MIFIEAGFILNKKKKLEIKSNIAAFIYGAIS